MNSQTFLNGRVSLHAGDCLDQIKLIPDASIDSVVTDPPYALVSITKRFGKAGSAPVVVPEGKSGAYARASAGFMGKAWDVGDRAFAVEFWAEVYRVVKPGGHVLAFGGTRTVHRLTCAIEDAGFEIRDMAAWMYGSGFPKSHDVAKGIDRVGGMSPRDQARLLRERRDAAGLSRDEVAARVGCTAGSIRDWEEGRSRSVGAATEWITPSEQYRGKLADLLGYSADERRLIASAVRRRGDGTVFGLGHTGDLMSGGNTAASATWEGWGTALKPAMEPITMARKPLVGTVAENVLAYGTGALNIAGCRVGTEARTYEPKGTSANAGMIRVPEHRAGRSGDEVTVAGRWPANVIHDGSDEVVAAFPDTGAASDRPRHNGDFKSAAKGQERAHVTFGHADAGGSAARFFYNAKADSDYRIGSKHPTVKPVDLMRYLVRLVTPPGGVVLDPFAGTGTTGEAAYREGFRAILIEREDEYRADIARRMELVLAGPDQRRHAIIKAKAKPDDLSGTLFQLPLAAAE